MLNMALSHGQTEEISYGIYTVERLPKGSKRTARWGLHSTAKDRMTAESHAKTLAAQPYFDYIEVQEFRTCPETKERKVHKIKSYSRTSTQLSLAITAVIATALTALAILSLL